MWQRFTQRARRIVFFAQDEAGKLGTNLVNSEHLLLGILREDDNVAVRILTTMSINLEALHADLYEMTPRGSGNVGKDMQLTAEAKRVIDLSYEEARRVGSNYIGTEHVLLGLLRDESSIAGQALSRAGVQLSSTRALLASLHETGSMEEAWQVALGAIGGKKTVENPEDRFTESARKLIVAAQHEARRLGATHYSTEHLLLALLREPSKIVTELLDRLGVRVETIETALKRQIAREDGPTDGDVAPTPRIRRVIAIAHDTSRQFADSAVGPEHLLMGLVAESEGLAGRVLLKLGVKHGNLYEAYTDIRLTALEGEIESKSRLQVQLESLEQRLAQLLAQPSGDTPPPSPDDIAPVPIFGDLGVASPSPGRAQIEVAHDAAAFRRLIAVFLAKDAYGYRTLTDGDQTVFLLPSGTPLKVLVPPRDAEDILETGHHVRVLSGNYAGYAGWIFKEAFKRTGVDDAAFPPEEV